jgi:CelD/BcsL family acetyltransferase involved in cellulose biosynthesis
MRAHRLDEPATDYPQGVRGARDTWSAEIRRDDDALASLAAEWRQLYARCSTATPFQSHAWLESWWREYGVSGRLRLVLVRKGGRLVAAAPLMVGRRGPWLVLRPLGQGLADFTEILLDDGCASEACRALAAALLAEPGWQVADFREARPGGAAERLYASWPAARWRLGGSVCLEIPAGSLDELLAGLSPRVASRIRNSVRKIDRLGITVRQVGVADVEQAVADLLRLHEQQWQGRGGDPEHLRPRFARHLARAVTGMIEQGQAAVFEHTMGERVVAVDTTMVGHGFVGTYLAGVDPGLRRQVYVATMLLRPVLALCERRGRPMVNLLRGEEPYKMRWHPAPVRNHRVLIGRPGPAPAAGAYAAAVWARAAPADALRHRLPWLREARNRVRQRVGRLGLRRNR